MLSKKNLKVKADKDPDGNWLLAAPNPTQPVNLNSIKRDMDKPAHRAEILNEVVELLNEKVVLLTAAQTKADAPETIASELEEAHTTITALQGIITQNRALVDAQRTAPKSSATANTSKGGEGRFLADQQTRDTAGENSSASSTVRRRGRKKNPPQKKAPQKASASVFSGHQPTFTTDSQDTPPVAKRSRDAQQKTQQQKPTQNKPGGSI